MKDAEYFAQVAKTQDPTMGDALEVLKMARNGDLVHIDGKFVQALADLADTGKAVYAERDIRRDSGGLYTVQDGGDYGTETDAIAALIMAADSLAGKPVLREAEPPTLQDNSAYLRNMKYAGRGQLLGEGV